MRIIILNYGLHMCGVSKALVNFANALSDAGNDVTIKIETNNFELKKFLKPEIKVSLFLNEPKFFTFRLKGFLKLYNIFLKFINKIPANLLYKIIVRKKYDVEISFNRGSSARIISSSNNNNSKKYIFVHSDYLKCSNPIAGFETQEQATEAYKKYNKIICVSEQCKKSFISKYNIQSNVYTCDNIFDENEIFNRSGEPIEEVFDKTTLVAVGRLCEAKAYNIMLDCCKKLNDNGYDYYLYIIGDGELHNELTDLKNSLYLNNVHFVGAKENPYSYLKKADIYVSSSIYEGLSTTTIEALILGVPVVVTDCTGMRDILCEGKYGIITGTNSESLFESISKLITDTELRKKYAKLSKERGKYYYKENTISRFFELIKDDNV